MDLYRIKEVERLEKDPIIIAMVSDLRREHGREAASAASTPFFARTAYDEYLRRGGSKDQLASIGGPARAIKKILGMKWED